jgi:hypothetical protein
MYLIGVDYVSSCKLSSLGKQNIKAAKLCFDDKHVFMAFSMAKLEVPDIDMSEFPIRNKHMILISISRVSYTTPYSIVKEDLRRAHYKITCMPARTSFTDLASLPRPLPAQSGPQSPAAFTDFLGSGTSVISPTEP